MTEILPRLSQITLLQVTHIQDKVDSIFRKCAPLTNRLIDMGLTMEVNGLERNFVEVFEVDRIKDSTSTFTDPPDTPSSIQYRTLRVPLEFTHIDFKRLREFDKAVTKVARLVEDNLLHNLDYTAKICPLHEHESVLRSLHYTGPFLRVKRSNRTITLNSTPDAVRMIIGLRPLVVQWSDHYKALCIMMPNVRRDLYGNCGVVITPQPFI